MCFMSHRVSKCARHNGLHKLSIQNPKIRVTRYPCGSRDKEHAQTQTVPPRIMSINPELSEAGRDVEPHREAADGVLTPPSPAI